MKLRRLVCLLAVALVAACRMPGDVATTGEPGGVATAKVPAAGEAVRASDGAPRLVDLEVRATLREPPGYHVAFASSQVAKVVVGLFDRGTHSSTNPLLGYFYDPSGVATESITASSGLPLSDSEFTGLQAAIGFAVGVGSADKTDARRYLFKYYTSPLPSSLTTNFYNVPIASGSAPVHAYNLLAGAFDVHGNVIGYTETDLTYELMLGAPLTIGVTVPLNRGGLGQINFARAMYYNHMVATSSVGIVTGVFDKATKPQLGLIDGDNGFDGSSKAYFDDLANYLASLGLSDTASSSRYLIKEYASASAPIGSGTNYFTNLPAGTSRYVAFMMAVRDDRYDAGHYASTALSVSTDATTSLDGGTFETGLVSTFLSGFSTPIAVAVAAGGDVYFNNLEKIYKYGPTGNLLASYGGSAPGFIDGSASVARFNQPSGLATDAAGNVYVGDCGNNAIRKIATDGTVTTVAGQGPTGAGFVNGDSTGAKFNCPRGLAVDSNGYIYVADSGNHAVRAILQGGTWVINFGGDGTAGYSGDGGGTISYNTPYSVAFTPDEQYLYVADSNNNRVRRTAVANLASTLIAGTGNCCTGEGPDGSQVPLNKPKSLAVDPDTGDIFMVDVQCAVRRISAVAPHEVKFIAGASGTCGNANGPPFAARFRGGSGIALYKPSNLLLFMTDTANFAVRKLIF